MNGEYKCSIRDCKIDGTLVTYVRRVLLDSTELIDRSGARARDVVRSEVHRSGQRTSSTMRHSVMEYVYAIFICAK